MSDKTYLGDGVYCTDDGCQIKFICDCMSEHNAIYVDHDAILKLAEKIKLSRAMYVYLTDEE